MTMFFSELFSTLRWVSFFALLYFCYARMAGCTEQEREQDCKAQVQIEQARQGNYRAHN